MSATSTHDDWLSLIEISGPFLAVPVLKEAFPQGLEELDATKRKRLRQAYEEWREALELEDAQLVELHVAWIDEVLSRGLELDEDGKGEILKRADWCAANLQATLPEHGVTLSPDIAVIDEQRANKPLMLIQTYAQHVELDATLKQDGWAATPADRMARIHASSRGFTYVVSVTGVTGVRAALESRVEPLVRALKEQGGCPVAVGFGISGPEQARQVRQWGADGAIVGSALVKVMAAAHASGADVATAAGRFCAELRQGLDQP